MRGQRLTIHHLIHENSDQERRTRRRSQRIVIMRAATVLRFAWVAAVKLFRPAASLALTVCIWVAVRFILPPPIGERSAA